MLRYERLLLGMRQQFRVSTGVPEGLAAHRDLLLERLVRSPTWHTSTHRRLQSHAVRGWLVSDSIVLQLVTSARRGRRPGLTILLHRGYIRSSSLPRCEC